MTPCIVFFKLFAYDSNCYFYNHKTWKIDAKNEARRSAEIRLKMPDHQLSLAKRSLRLFSCRGFCPGRGLGENAPVG